MRIRRRMVSLAKISLFGICASSAFGVLAAGGGSKDADSNETVTGPAKDYFQNAAFREKYRKTAVAIARMKMAQDVVSRMKRDIEPKVEIRPRISTGGGFSGFFVWDSVFGIMWGRYVDGIPLHGTLDNFYALQQEDGFICREYDSVGQPMWRPTHPVAYNPPILAWAEIELYRAGKSDKARLEKVYPKLVRFHECYDRNLKRSDGLYFSDILGGGMGGTRLVPRALRARRLGGRLRMGKRPARESGDEKGRACRPAAGRVLPRSTVARRDNALTCADG